MRIVDPYKAKAPGEQRERWEWFIDELANARAFRRAILYVAVLQVFDIFTTWLILRWGGVEANPFMSPVIHNALLVLLVKATIVFFLACRWWSAQAENVLKAHVMLGAYMLVVLSNGFVLYQLAVR